MSKDKKIVISCTDANHFCDKSQYKEASFWEKAKLNIHLIYCKACRKYTASNTKLTRLMKDPKLLIIKESDKKQMKKLLEERLTNQSK